MKYLFFLGLLLALPGCAHSAPVVLAWTYPTWNANPGSCSATPDTLRDLGTFDIWAQRQGRTDSTLVITKTCVGREGKPDSVVVEQPEGVTLYWGFVYDTSSNRSCKSNVTSKLVTSVPTPATFK